MDIYSIMVVVGSVFGAILSLFFLLLIDKTSTAFGRKRGRRVADECGVSQLWGTEQLIHFW